MKRFLLFLLFGAFGLCLTQSLYAEGKTDRLEGLVFEVEDWTEPKAWQIDKHSPNLWQIWTKEEDVINKRSRGASITTPVLNKTEDRATPEDGAPPLHTKITGIPNGLYQVFVSGSNRPLAYSMDGKEWFRFEQYGENTFGIYDIQDGTFEVWVDDRYASPNSPGWAYYDYIRFVPVEKYPQNSHVAAFTLPTGETQISWITDVPSPRGAVAVDGVEYEEERDGMRNHRVIVPGLKKGKNYSAEVSIKINRSGQKISQNFDFQAGFVPSINKTQKTSVKLTVAEPTDFPRNDWPVASGVPFPRGILANAENVQLKDENGAVVPAQFETFATWDDGSVKWLFCTFRASTRSKTEKPVTFTLETSPDFKSLPGVSPLTEEEMLAFARSLKSCVEFEDGTETKCNPQNFELVSRGKEAAVLRSVNDFTPGDGVRDFLTGYEITFFGNDFIRIRSTLANREFQEPMTLVRSAEISIPGGKASPRLSVLQDLVDHAEIVCGAEKSTVERWGGLVSAPDGTYWMRDFWQLWPKGMSCAENSVSFKILPRLPEGYAPENCDTPEELTLHYYWLKNNCYQFKRGMELRHDFWVVKPGREVNSEWLQEPLFAVAEPEYYCSVGVFPPVNPVEEGKWDDYEEAVRVSFAQLEEGRRLRQEYGWMNFGDWYGERKHNWGNGEYDLSYVCALHFARSGDLAYLKRGIEMARHYATVDRKAWLWNPNERERQYTHCYGHVNYFFSEDDPRVQDLRGTMKYSMFRWESDGSGGHTFLPGEYYVSCLTGDRYLWDAAVSSARNQAEKYTPRFNFSIERSAGWSLKNAVYSYRFTNDPYFLNAARIYLETIVAKQNSVTGCFDLPQDQSECDCPDKKEHRGGKAFATGILLHALIRYAETVPDEDQKELARRTIVRCADWLLDYSWNEEKMGFRYKTGCPKYLDHGWYSTLVTEGLAYAGETTGNPRYAEFLLRTLPPQLKRTSGTGRGCGKSFAQMHRQMPHTLYWLQKYQDQKKE